jgi:hypothetical protein
MAENKYLRAMQQASEHVGKPQPEPSPALPSETDTLEPPRVPTQPRSAGRPPGKRSNPDWEQVTLFLRKDTKRAAIRRLMDDQSGRDLSEVIEQLLSKWSKIA